MAKHAVFSSPDLQTAESIRKQRKIGYKTRFVYFGRANQIVRLLQLSLRLTTRKVQTSLCSFSPTIVSNCTSSNLGYRQQNKKRPKMVVIYFGSPNQIRTGVLALKGRCPRPLDDGAKTATFILKTPPNYNRHLCLCQGFYAGYFYSFIQLVLVLLLQVLQQPLLQLFLSLQLLLAQLFLQLAGIPFLCLRRSSMLNDHPSSHTIQQLS